jgi:hypothetical protein
MRTITTEQVPGLNGLPRALQSCVAPKSAVNLGLGNGCDSYMNRIRVISVIPQLCFDDTKRDRRRSPSDLDIGRLQHLLKQNCFNLRLAEGRLLKPRPPWLRIGRNALSVQCTLEGFVLL